MSRDIEPVKVIGGLKAFCEGEAERYKTVINKSDIGKIEYKVECSESINAPVKIGDKIGRISYYLAGNEIGSADILSDLS